MRRFLGRNRIKRGEDPRKTTCNFNILDYVEDVVPHYDWFNGHVEYATDEVIAPRPRWSK
ncbi:hypothetical protein AKJ29_09090 [Aliiroseovarius crassostreae]|uniref:Uncharacterized protein n=1 Tax=Aliiroseovarius crassostreae TaxID=154981 RepID=A0A0P7I0M5_9RHOB|nr:hypothetical protein [Aliiroseovarius crassostreae]KPN62380.1 hypothetical protein AKJ29_09090 [Aliiroseovarius crassostreae]